MFECARVALKHLNLSCCHLGVPGVTQLSWRDIPDLWPNLETIDLFCATDLTMDNLRLFVFRMENLKWIGVHLIDWEDEEEVKSFDDLMIIRFVFGRSHLFTLSSLHACTFAKAFVGQQSSRA